MNRIKQRTTVVAAALAALIGGGAALQALAAGPDAASQSLPTLLASQTAVTARVIDPTSLAAAFTDGDAMAGAFADQTSYADLLLGALTSSGATFSSTAAAPGRDLTALAGAVSGVAAAPATLSDTVSYASTLRAAHLNSGASFQLSQQVAALDLATLAAAVGDGAAEQVTFSEEGSQLGDAYYNPELASGTFSGEAGTTAGRSLSSLAAAAATGGAPSGTFAGQAVGGADLSSAYYNPELGSGTFSSDAGAAQAVPSLADLAASVGGASAGEGGLLSQAATSSYADSLRAAHAGFAGFDTGFSADAGVGAQFDLDALAEAVSEE